MQPAGIAGDRQVVLRANPLHDLDVIAIGVMLPMAMSGPDVDVLKPRRGDIRRDRRKMLRRGGLDRRRVMRHPVRWSPIIQRTSDIIGRNKADLWHLCFTSSLNCRSLLLV